MLHGERQREFGLFVQRVLVNWMRVDGGVAALSHRSPASIIAANATYLGLSMMRFLQARKP